MQLAMFYQEHDELNSAIEEYTNILKIDPKYKAAHYNLGYIHLVYLKVYDVALKHFSNAILCDPNYAEPIITGVTVMSCLAILIMRCLITRRLFR